MRARLAIPLLALTAAACNVDAVLEGKVDPEIHLSVAIGASLVSVAPGGTATLTASITRAGTFDGPVDFALSGLPTGVTAAISPQSTSGKVSTVTVTFDAAANASAGSYVITIRGTAAPNGNVVSTFELRVVANPAVVVAPSAQSVAIIRGGIAPINVTLARTNFTGAVTLALTGNAGISASFATNPITGSGTAVMLSVAASVAPGTYTLSLRGTGDGISEAVTPFTVIVPPDALQLIGADVAATQASAVTGTLIVNRFALGDAVALSASGLPAGVTATFLGGATPGTTASVRFAVAASVPTGSYQVMLRGRTGSGVEATVAIMLTVGPSNVAMWLVPQNVTLLQGTSGASLLSLVRTSFTGAVSVQVEGVPTGITVVPADPTITGSSTTLLVATSRTLLPGLYTIGVRVVPAPTADDVPPLDPVVAQFFVTVLEAPLVSANVVLDWSACAAPRWVAAQDGNSPWTAVTGAQRRFQFALTSVRGAYAWDDGTQVVVRYATSAELTAAPVIQCTPPAPATHSVIGTAQHASAPETATWRLGGGVATSSFTLPSFTISGVRDGTHDLVGYGFIQSLAPRMFIARDVNEPAGGSVGTTTLTGTGSFGPTSRTVVFTGLQNDRLSYTMSYLTTAACTENELYQSGTGTPLTGSSFQGLPGVPTQLQRPGDYHLVSAAALGVDVTRSASVAFNQMPLSSRTVAFPPDVTPSITALTGSYSRLRLVLQEIPPPYNGQLALRYTDGTRSVTVRASVAALTQGVAVLDMPDLSGVAGFTGTSMVPSGARGSWTMTLDGATGEPTMCAENAARWAITRTGAY